MRHRLGGVHCQTYEELFDILDAKPPPCSPTLDIDSLLLQQQLVRAAHYAPQDYFFDQKHQIQSEEQQLVLTLQAERSRNAVRSYSLVLICEELARLRDTLLNKEFVQRLYASMYAQMSEGKVEVQVEVGSNIASVSLKGQNLCRESQEKRGEQVESGQPEQCGGQSANLKVATSPFCGCIFQALQLVIYYNKIEQQINKGQHPITHQHKIWLLHQQPHYSPLLAVYLQTADSVFRAHFDPQIGERVGMHDLKLEEMSQLRGGECKMRESRGREGEIGGQGGKELRDVLRQLENGVRKGRTKRS